VYSSRRWSDIWMRCPAERECGRAATFQRAISELQTLGRAWGQTAHDDCRAISSHVSGSQDRNSARVGRAVRPLGTGDPIHAAESRFARIARCRQSSSAVRRLRARLLLASPRGLPSNDDTQTQSSVLAGQVRSERSARSACDQSIASLGFSRRRGLGMPDGRCIEIGSPPQPAAIVRRSGLNHPGLRR